MIKLGSRGGLARGLFAWLAVLGSFLLIPAVEAHGVGSDSIPAPCAEFYVCDFAGVLSVAASHNMLERALKVADNGAGPQIVVITVPSLGGMELEPYATQLFNKWGIGDASRNDGVLLLIAPVERRTRLEVGTGANKTAITDRGAQQILDSAVIPYLRNDNWDAGATTGQEAIIAAFSGDRPVGVRSRAEVVLIAALIGLGSLALLGIGIVVFRYVRRCPQCRAQSSYWVQREGVFMNDGAPAYFRQTVRLCSNCPFVKYGKPTLYNWAEMQESLPANQRATWSMGPMWLAHNSIDNPVWRRDSVSRGKADTFAARVATGGAFATQPTASVSFGSRKGDGGPFGLDSRTGTGESFGTNAGIGGAFGAAAGTVGSQAGMGGSFGSQAGMGGSFGSQAGMGGSFGDLNVGGFDWAGVAALGHKHHEAVVAASSSSGGGGSSSGGGASGSF